MLRVGSRRSDLMLLAALLALYFAISAILLLATPRERIQAPQISTGEAEKTVILFTSPNCGLCEKIKPYWSQLEPPAGVEMIELSLGDPEVFDIAVSYRIAGTPTILVLDNSGREIARIEWDKLVTVASARELSLLIEEALAADSGIGSLLRREYSLAVYPVLGAALALSPCTAPLLALYASASATARPSLAQAARCGLLAALGVSGIGLLVLLSLGLLASLVEVLPRALGFLLVAVGLTAIASEESLASSRRLQAKSLDIACAGFSILASQCSLPLLAGAVLSPAAAGSLALGLAALALFATGLALVLSLVVLTAGRVADRVYKLAGVGNLEKATGALIVALGLYASLGW